MTIEESDEPGVGVRFVEGMVVENGWLSPYMVRDQHRMETVFENPYVFMTNKPLKHPNDLHADPRRAVAKDPRPLVILAENAEARALGMLVANTQHGTLEAVAVRAPGFGHRRIQHLGDLAAFCGGTVIAEEAGLSLERRDARALRHRAAGDRHRRRLHVHRGRRDRRGRRRAARAAARGAGARGARPRRRDPAASGSRGCRPTWP